MNKYVRELLGGSLIYGLSGMITSVIMLFLVPVYTRVFTPADYGILNLVNITYFLLTLIVVFGLDNSAALWYWDKTEEAERKKTFASWMYFSFVISLLIAAVIVLFSERLSLFLLQDAKYSLLLDLMAVSLVFTSWQKVINIWFRVQKKPVWAMSYALIVSLTTIGLSIFLVVKLNFGLSGVYWAQLGASVICFILSLILMRNWISPKYFDQQRLREMLRFAAPLVPAVISMWLMNSAGSYFIQQYVDKTEVGLYQLGVSLASAISLASGAFMQAWSPFAFSIAKEENHQRTYAGIFLIYVYWSSLALLGMFLFAPEVLMILVPPNFHGAAFVAGLVGLNIVILSLPEIVVIGCSLAKTNMPFGTATIIGSIISVILFLLLIPSNGKEGAVLATIAGNVFIFFYVYRRAQKLYFIPYDLPRAVLVIVIAIILSFTGLWITAGESLAFGLTIKFALFATFAAAMTVFTYKTKDSVAGTFLPD